jgi:N-acyl-D-aspartate/D-glutamate deacylase
VANVDIVIRGGTLADGSGGELFEADIAIDEGRIVGIEKGSGNCIKAGREEIDARGRLVTPGFVDVHTHYDAQATWASHLTPSSNNGVTTVLMGNCGVGFAPVHTHHHAMLIELMEGVEDIPEVVLSEGLEWNWNSFPDYLDALAARTFDVDVGTQVPHAALRVFVMGERGARREPATLADQAEMATLAAEGIRAGAFGFSTSRLLQHRTASGEPVPSYGAAAEELQTIAKAVAAEGRGWLQVVADFGPEQEAEFSLLRQLAEDNELALTLTLLQRDSWPDEWHQLLRRIEQANAAGVRMTGQTRGRPTSTLLGFELSNNPFRDCPSYQPLLALPFSERIEALSDAALRERLLREPAGDEAQRKRTRNWERIFKLGNPPEYEPRPSTSVAATAERRAMSPEALAFEWLIEEGGRGILYRPTTNYTGGDMAPVLEMLRHPNTLVGLGDGGAHVGVMCDATDMTHALTHWTRDRTRGERLSVPHIVRRLSANNAQALGLCDRGILEVGKRADINVIDYENLRLHPPQIHYDLPAGGKRLLQRADGYDATLVAGEVVWRDGEPTGALPGRLLRSRAR